MLQRKYMLYEKDFIHFHTLLEAVRIQRGVTIEKLCAGLCSVSQMYYIQQGLRLPDYLMRNRIMSRLGISSEGYEDYVRYDEYERWCRRQLLIELVEDSNWNDAKNLLADLKKEKGNSKIEQQFLLDMQARIRINEGASDEEICEIYKRIISLTIPQKDYLGLVYLSEVEYFYIINYLSYKANTDNNKKEEAIRELCIIIKNIIQAPLEGIACAKILPFAVVKYYEIAKSYEYLSEQLWKVSCEAIDILKETERTYYLEELVWVRKQVLSSNDRKYDMSLEEEVVSILNILKKDYDIKIPTWQNGFIYRDSQVYCISDVITKRRRMMGISRQELADGICSERTLERIEAMHSNPQQYVMRSLFEKMNLAGEYRRNEIITDNIDLINIFIKYRKAINQKQYNNAIECSKQLIRDLNKKYIPNQQVIIRMQNLNSYFANKIDKDVFVSNLEKALRLSINVDISKKKDFFLTTGEMVLLYNIAVQKDEDWIRKKLDDYFNNYEGYKKRSFFSLYELIKDWEAGQLGNRGKYEESNDISMHIIIESLRLNRLHGLYRAISNMAWNEYEYKKDEALVKYNDMLKMCISLCDFSQNKMAEVYRKALK